MSRQIIVFDDARYDAIDIAYEIAEYSLEVSDRFTEALDAAYERLAEMPGIGAFRNCNNPKLQGMRMLPLPNFPKYLIFYRANISQLEVLRVLHSSRDIESLFAPDEED